MGIFLGAVSIIAEASALFLTWKAGGEAPLQFGAVILLCVIFSMTGIILSILSAGEKETAVILSKIGAAVNSIALIICAVFVYLGTL